MYIEKALHPYRSGYVGFDTVCAQARRCVILMFGTIILVMLCYSMSLCYVKKIKNYDIKKSAVI